MERRAGDLGETHSESCQGLRTEASVGKTLGGGGGGGRKYNLTSGGRPPHEMEVAPESTCSCHIAKKKKKSENFK